MQETREVTVSEIDEFLAEWAVAERSGGPAALDRLLTGNPVPAAVRASLILIPQPGGWRLAGSHLSFIAGTPGAPSVPGRS